MQRETKYNLMGQRFGKLVVIDRAEDIEREWNGKHISRVAWLCRCDCGRTKIADQGSLLSGRTKTCGNSECRKGRRVIRNKYDLSGEYGIGYLEDGSEFYFDLEDYDLIKDYRWSKNNGYIVCYKVKNGKRYRVHLHRLVMGLDNKDERVVDHINLKRNDNRKENLRMCTRSQNQCNTRSRGKYYKGVSYRKKEQTYRVVITINKHTYYIGDYKTLDDAIKARQEAEKIYHGEFAYKGN